MDTVPNIATYDETGRPVVRPMTQSELVELEALQREAQANAPVLDFGEAN